MKHLYLIRSARSSWEEEGADDFERSISSKGRSETLTIASYLKVREIVPDRIISSCAMRAQESSDLLAERLEYTGRVEYFRELYMTPSEKIRQIITAQDDETVESLFVVAHAPWIQELANRLMDEHLKKFPPMGVAALEIDIDHWDDLADGTARLDFFIYPKQFEYYMPRQIRAYLPR